MRRLISRCLLQTCSCRTSLTVDSRLTDRDRPTRMTVISPWLCVNLLASVFYLSSFCVSKICCWSENRSMLSAVYYQHVSREINIHQNIWPQLRQKLYAVGASLLADASRRSRHASIAAKLRLVLVISCIALLQR